MAGKFFSANALHRGTFLSERNSEGAVFDYSSDLQALKARLPESGRLSSRLNDLCDRLNCHSSSVSNGKIPSWAAFIAKLASKPSSPPISLVNSVISALTDSYCKTEAYASPFITAAQSLLDRIYQAQSCKGVASLSPETLTSLGKWYISRQIEIARFVLHLAYSKSGLDYSSWCNQFEKNETHTNPWFVIGEEYPVLIRWLANIDQNCIASINELFYRFFNDRDEIATLFGISSDAILKDVDLGLSDPHRGGRSVIRLHFGNGLSLIYKPKPLEIDAAFNAFVSKHEQLGLQGLRVLPKPDYGWVEDANGFEPNSDSCLHSKAIGQASACFWLLNTTDMHSENVMLKEKGVFALDLETLLLAPAASKAPEPEEPLWRNHSIYTTLLFDYSYGENRKQNISGFDPSPNLRFIGPQINFELVDNTVKISSSEAPKLDPLSSKLSTRYSDANSKGIVNGFESVISDDMRKALAHFVSNLDDNFKTRIVFRDTYFYARILDRMRQPRFLRDGALLSLDLHALHIGLVASSVHNKQLHDLVDDEIRQLLQGDIPYFSNKVGGLDLKLSSGTIKKFFWRSGKSHSLSKIKGLEKSDIEEQTALIKIALGHYRISTAKFSSDKHPDDFQSGETEQIIFWLKELALSIVSSAFHPSRSPARWISMFGDVSGHESKINVGDHGYFSGLWGIVLTLQAIEKVTNEHHLADNTLRAFLDQQALLLCQRLENKVPNPIELKMSLLGFSGLAGEIFAISTLIGLNNDRWGFLRPYAGRLLAGVKQNIGEDPWLDVIGGSAGLALGCEQFLKLNILDEWHLAAETTQQTCALHIVHKACNTHPGLAWIVPGEKLPLLGYAHGWAGIVAALACTMRRTRNEVHKTMIEACLKEASAFPTSLLATHGEWRDYRTGTPTPAPLNRSWCNGLPGILRGLLETQNFWSEEVRQEFGSLVDKTIKSVGSSETYRFCCGEMGNVDFLLDYSRVLKSEENGKLYSRALSVTKNILSQQDEAHEHLVPELAFPGLFHGRSGIAFSAARLLTNELPSLSGQHMADIPI